MFDGNEFHDVDAESDHNEPVDRKADLSKSSTNQEMSDFAKQSRPRDDAAAAAFFAEGDGPEASEPKGPDPSEFKDDGSGNQSEDDKKKEEKKAEKLPEAPPPAPEGLPKSDAPKATPSEAAQKAGKEYEEYKKALNTPESERTPAQKDLLERVKAGTAGDQYIRNPIDPNASTEEKIEQLRKLSQENEKLVKGLAEDMHDRFGAKDVIEKSKLWGYKNPKDIEAKAQREEILLKKPWHDVEHIRDAIRFRTVVNDVADIPKILEELKRRGFEIIKPEPEKLSNPRDTRLRMAPFDLRAPNGQIIEYYILPKESFEAMDGGHHAIYKKWRERKVEELTPEEKIERNKDLLRMREMGDKAWEKYLERTGQTQEQVDGVVKRVQEIAAEPPKTTQAQAEQTRPARVVPTADRVQGTDTRVNPDGSLARTDAKPGEVLAREQLEKRERLDPKEMEALKRTAEELSKSDKDGDKKKAEALNRTIEALEGKHGVEAQVAAHKEMIKESRSALERGEGGGYGRAVVGGLIGVGILVGAALACYNHSLKQQEQRALERARVK